MTQDSESVVVPRVPTEAMQLAVCKAEMEAGPDAVLGLSTIWRIMVDAAPSTSVREEDVEAAAKRMFETEYPDAVWEEWAEYCRRYSSVPTDIPLWRSRARAALVPSTDEGKAS